MSRVRVRLLVGLTSLATVAAVVLSPLPSSADEPVAIPLEGFDGEIIYQGGEGDGILVLPQEEDGVQVAPQCLDVSGNVVDLTDPTKACVGMATPEEPLPLEFGGIGDLFPFVKDPAAAGALNWIVVEGMQSLRAMYDLPQDYRIGRWARPELRAYVTDRLLLIMDKKVYGVPLDANEAAALTFLEQHYLEEDRFLAQAAYDEYVAFKASPCTYRPPAPPEVVTQGGTKPETLPNKVKIWCQTNARPLNVPDPNIAPPLPTPTQFTTWATYRYADELGITAFADPVVQRNYSSMVVGIGAMSGLALAAIAGGAVYWLASGTTFALNLGTLLFPHVAKPLYQFGSEFVKIAARLAAKGAATWAGAAIAAGIAAVVIVAIVVVAIATYLVIQHESVAATLRDRIDTAKKSSDPFGLAPLTKIRSGQPLNSAILIDKPAYRTAESHAKLARNVLLWTTLDGQGTPRPDPSGIWPDSGPTDDDPKFVVRVGNGEPQLMSRIRVPQEGGLATVSMSRGWFALVEPGAPTRGALSFGYLDQDGEPRIAQRAPASVGGFIVTDTERGEAENVPALTYRNAAGELVRARLQPRALNYVDGPRPVAVGPLTAGRPVMLRPNPVGTDGSSLDPTVVQEDYDFDWTVERQDPTTGEWTPVHSAASFGTSWVASQTGAYEARVTMTAKDDPTQKKYGIVQFSVVSPSIGTPVLELEDNGISRLELDLQLLEEVPTDDMTVEVTWPGDVGTDTDPVTTLELECFRTGPLECTTMATGPSNLLVHDVTPTTDLSRPVRVLVRNATGGVLQEEFLLGEGRPSLAPPPEGVNDPEPGSVIVGDTSTQVEMPIGHGNQDYVAARLVPSTGGGQAFGLVDPDTGNTTANVAIPGAGGVYASVFEEGGEWFLSVWGNPGPQHLGSFDVPIVVAQTNSTRQLSRITVHIVPSTGDRFRAVLQTDVDPLDTDVDELPVLLPSILGGKVGEPAYSGEMCLSLQRVDFGAPPVVRCRDSVEFFATDGEAKPFPYAELFPTGTPSGTYRASAWLNTPGELVDTEPLEVRFFLTEDADYTPPQVRLGDVTVAGKPLVGKRLRAKVSSVEPEDAGLRYQWLRDGAPIRGGDSRTYDVVKADRGNRLSVKVIAKEPDWTKDVERSSKVLVR